MYELVNVEVILFVVPIRPFLLTVLHLFSEGLRIRDLVGGKEVRWLSGWVVFYEKGFKTLY